MRNFLGVLFLITIAFSAFCQSDDSKDFKDRYLEQRTLLLSNFHLKEQALNEESKMLSQLNDTQLVLHDLLFFDINEINKNNNLLKDLGHKLKSKEILFNTYSIKSFIELRYLKTLSLEKQDETFNSTFKSIVTNAKQNRDFYSLSQAYMANAEHKININQRDSVLYYINLAVVNARKQTQKSLLTDVILNQAELYRRLKNDESAISKAYLALQLSVENKYNYGVYQANIILAMINEQHESTAEMKRNLKQARDAAKAMNFQEGVLFTTLFELQSKNEYTPEDYKTILSIKKATQVPLELQAMIATIESQMFIFSGNYIEAQSLLNRAIVEYEKIGNIDGLQRSYQRVAEIFLKQKKYDKAILYLQKSISLLEEANNKTESTLLLKKMSDLYALKGNISQAYSILRKYINIKDSLQLADLQLNLLLQQQQNKVDERERLITLQSDSIREQRKEQNYTITMLENVQLKNNLKTYIIIGFVGLILLAGIIIFFKWNQNLIQQQQKEAEMNQTLLRTQMNPHFVFNAMSVIQSYIYENDTKNSTKFLVNFSKLMRLILENSSKEFIPISIEEEILQKYLSVQKLRFEDRFKFDIFTERVLLDEEVLIPPMITQPFIENAIEHGQLHRREDGFISVSFKKLDDRLIEIKVIDNGIGWKNDSDETSKSKTHKSMATGITKSRIASLNKKYKTDGFIKYEEYNKTDGSGTIVTITLPYTLD